MAYTYTTTYTTDEQTEAEREDEEHVERVGADVYTVEYTTEVTDARGRTSLKKLTGTLVCSCGHSTCPMVTRYGLPRPIYAAEIETMPRPQWPRDKRAAEIRAEFTTSPEAN